MDVFIANAAIAFPINKPLSLEATENPDQFEKNMFAAYRTNTVGTIQAVAYFAPLVVKSDLKKIAVISTALGDIDFTLQVGFGHHSPYATSKAAVNMAVAKFHIELREKGVTVFAISPGLVATEFATDPTAPPPTAEEQAALYENMTRNIALFKAYAPNWEPRPLTPTESAQMVVKVIAGATIEKNGGRMVSHFGTKQWL